MVRSGYVTDDPVFGVKVRELLIERGMTTAIGNPNWPAFALEAGVGYESLRKAVTGERWPGIKLIEQVAEALGVEPGVFVEYRLEFAQKSFDPRQVGQEVALRNLAAWERVVPSSC